MTGSRVAPGWYPMPGTESEVMGYWDGVRWNMVPARLSGAGRRRFPKWMTAVGAIPIAGFVILLIIGLTFDPDPLGATHENRSLGIPNGVPLTVRLADHFEVSTLPGVLTEWRIAEGDLPPGVSISAQGVVRSDGSAQVATNYAEQIILNVTDSGGDSMSVRLELVVLQPNSAYTEEESAGMLRKTINWTGPEVHDAVVKVFDLGMMSAAEFADHRASDDFVQMWLTDGASIARCQPGSEGPDTCDVRFFTELHHAYMSAVLWSDAEGGTQWNFFLDYIE